MKKLYAAVYPNGDFTFESINSKSDRVKINPSDLKYGNVRVRTINMKKFTGQLPVLEHDYDLWEKHKIAWIWSNPDNSLWWDTLSLTKESTYECSTNPKVLIALGFKVIPVQFSPTVIAHLMAA